jgi:hypothetical protein
MMACPVPTILPALLEGYLMEGLEVALRGGDDVRLLHHPCILRGAALEVACDERCLVHHYS